jgi:jasmonic acid-amino synthetase
MTVSCVDYVIERFEEMTRNPKRVQRETLRKILEENKDAEYLRKFGLEGRTDEESFKMCVPLCTHQDVEPYIRRIADGDGDSLAILTGKSITSLSLRFVRARAFVLSVYWCAFFLK